ncbi:CANB2 [Enterospora canceri]|uniref:Calcineurin subunit B n=1 Tax=Enterospora canceri TaxID=1081671 RepID=A0A1Y1S5Y6_9MICR|nr:CANB2 [Enterospora canceri]
MDGKDKYVKKSDITSVGEFKSNPITNILIKKYTKANKVNFTRLCNDLFEFLNSNDLDTKLRFLFKLYDQDNDGFISGVELYDMLKLLNKNMLENWKIQNIVDKTFAEIGEYTTTMDFEQFKSVIIRKNNNLCDLMDCL